MTTSQEEMQQNLIRAQSAAYAWRKQAEKARAEADRLLDLASKVVNGGTFAAEGDFNVFVTSAEAVDNLAEGANDILAARSVQ